MLLKVIPQLHLYIYSIRQLELLQHQMRVVFMNIKFNVHHKLWLIAQFHFNQIWYKRVIKLLLMFMYHLIWPFSTYKNKMVCKFKNRIHRKLFHFILLLVKIINVWEFRLNNYNKVNIYILLHYWEKLNYH